MTEYPDVPDDVMRAAVEACRRCLDENKPVEWAAIYAILAERERCAEVAGCIASEGGDAAAAYFAITEPLA